MATRAPTGAYSFKAKLTDFGEYAIDGEPITHNGTEDWIAYHGKNTSTYTYSLRTARVQKTLKVRVTGSKNGSSSNAVISLDRIEIYS